MAFGYHTSYHGCQMNGPDHLISNHLNTEQVKVCYSDKFAIQILAIQISTVLRYDEIKLSKYNQQ